MAGRVGRRSWGFYAAWAVPPIRRPVGQRPAQPRRRHREVGVGAHRGAVLSRASVRNRHFAAQTTREIERDRFQSADGRVDRSVPIVAGNPRRTVALTDSLDASPHSGPVRSLISVMSVSLRDSDIAVSGNLGAVHFHADWVRITLIVSSCLFFVGKLLGDVNKYKINKRDILIWEIPLFSIGMVGREVGILPSNYAVTAVKLRSYCRQTTHPKKLIHKRFAVKLRTS